MRAYDLTVSGSLVVSGSTTLTGDITYDDLTATGDIITTGANKVISGSSTSTGSFGYLNVDGQAIVSGMTNSNLVNVSSSLSTRVTRNEATGSSLTSDSSSFSSRVARLETSGSITYSSASFSTRVTTEEGNVDTLQSTMTTEQTNIDNLQTDSGSFSTRVSNLKSDSGSFSTRITAVTSSISALKTDSGSFSTRIDNSEASGALMNQDLMTSASPTFVNVTATGTMTAQEFHTEFVSASIVYKSGSTKFGDTGDDEHQFTGSIQQSGSTGNHYFQTGKVGIGTNNPDQGKLLHIWDSNSGNSAISGDSIVVIEGNTSNNNEFIEFVTPDDHQSGFLFTDGQADGYHTYVHGSTPYHKFGSGNADRVYINASGVEVVTGNISGSSTSTGSFGNVHVM